MKESAMKPTNIITVALVALAIVCIVSAAGALKVEGATITQSLGQGSTGTATMYVSLSPGEPETNVQADIGNMPEGVSISVNTPVFHIAPGQRLPVVATVAIAADAPLGYSQTGILIHPAPVHGKGIGFSTAISVPCKITVTEPAITKVSFTSDKIVGSTPLTILFTGNVVGGGATQPYYRWEYAKRVNDVAGERVRFSTVQNPQFTFTDLGTYDVYFTAGNALGSTSIGALRYVTVKAVPAPTPAPTPIPTPVPTVAPSKLPVYYEDGLPVFLYASGEPVTYLPEYSADGGISQIGGNCGDLQPGVLPAGKYWLWSADPDVTAIAIVS